MLIYAYGYAMDEAWLWLCLVVLVQLHCSISDMTSVSNWTCKDVGEWLNEVGFSSYKHLFCDEHLIDGAALLTLTENDLRQPPLQMTVLGDLKRLLVEIRSLQSHNQDAMSQLGLNQSSGTSPTYLLGGRRHCRKRPAVSMSTDDEVDTHRQLPLQPEYIKLVISYAYMFSVFWMTSFTMVIVHDRVPDMEKYPPLPDLFLDNMPYVPWAFDMCECTAVVLATITSVMLFFHKHRFIILRRFFAMMGTVFMLRCVTMLITSLSVPGKHLACEPTLKFDGMWSKVERTFLIWRGFGMSLQGVRTCGDYMFSGHTVVITMLNFFNTEYIPRRIHYVHTASWVMNIFGIFFILAAHEHYSIDVFIAFYITSRLFLYYHSLANTRMLMHSDKRMRIWFPLFSFFEARVNGIVPNTYEWPLPWPVSFCEYFEPGKKVR